MANSEVPMRSHSHSSESNRVGKAERLLYAAMICKDYAALEQILSAGLVYVHSTAVAESKAEYLAGIAKGLYEYERIESHGVGTRVHGDVAIMSGTVVMSVGASGQPKAPVHLLFVLVWVKRADAWQLEYRQATRLSDR